MLGTVVAIVLPSPPVATAAHGKDCGVVSKGAGDYRVRARVMGCRPARRWIARYLADGSRPSGYSCVNPSGPIRVYCSRGSKSYWATRL